MFLTRLRLRCRPTSSSLLRARRLLSRSSISKDKDDSSQTSKVSQKQEAFEASKSNQQDHAAVVRSNRRENDAQRFQRFHEAITKRLSSPNEAVVRENEKKEEPSYEDIMSYAAKLDEEYFEELPDMRGNERDVLHVKNFSEVPTVEEIRAWFGEGAGVERVFVSQGYTLPFAQVKFTSKEAAVQAHDSLQRTPIVHKGKEVTVGYAAKDHHHSNVSPPTTFLFFVVTTPVLGLRAEAKEEGILGMVEPRHRFMIRSIRLLPRKKGRTSGLVQCIGKNAARTIKEAYGDKMMLSYSVRSRSLGIKVKEEYKNEIRSKEDLQELLKPHLDTIDEMKLCMSFSTLLPTCAYTSLPLPREASTKQGAPTGRIDFISTNAAIDFEVAHSDRLEITYIRGPDYRDATPHPRDVISDRIVRLGNLPPLASEEQVRRIAGAYGRVALVHIPKDPHGHPANFASIQFRSAISARNFCRVVEGGKDDGQRLRLTAKLVNEIQTLDSNVLHLTGFGKRAGAGAGAEPSPTKEGLVRFFGRFGEEIVRVVVGIGKNKTSHFAQVHFTSSEIATQALCSTRASRRYEGQEIRVFYSKKAVGPPPGDRLYFLTTGKGKGSEKEEEEEEEEIKGIFEEWRGKGLVEEVRILPKTSPRTPGLIQCRDAEAAAAVHEAFKKDDRVTITYARVRAQNRKADNKLYFVTTEKGPKTPWTIRRVLLNEQRSRIRSMRILSGNRKGVGVPGFIRCHDAAAAAAVLEAFRGDGRFEMDYARVRGKEDDEGGDGGDGNVAPTDEMV
ncbi:Splicing factor [Marasmius crinis-equi]|uniref:Splicing factor n=1 Tax=Marasmius crinis-equi TaxID=585013 RepID=A0ABR3ENI7_9AGAR